MSSGCSKLELWFLMLCYLLKEQLRFRLVWPYVTEAERLHLDASRLGQMDSSSSLPPYLTLVSNISSLKSPQTGSWWRPISWDYSCYKSLSLCLCLSQCLCVFLYLCLPLSSFPQALIYDSMINSSLKLTLCSSWISFFELMRQESEAALAAKSQERLPYSKTPQDSYIDIIATLTAMAPSFCSHSTPAAHIGGEGQLILSVPTFY